MKPDAIKTAIIRAAVRKSISDIKASPGRGMRNLIDFGDMFASGRFQHEFFGSVSDYLSDENSMYYKLIKRVALQTDPEVFCKFGINLGYNALTHGAKMIRRIEELEGYNVPWCLTFELGPGVSTGTLERVIRQGRAMGIYCYIVDSSSAEIESALALLAKQGDCAIVLLTSADRITEETCRIIGGAKNIMPLVSAHGGAAPADACSLLRKKGCLYGVFSKDPISGDKMELAYKCKASVAAHVTQSVRDMREAERHTLSSRRDPRRPVLPLSLYSDIAHAGRRISSEACFAIIGGDGVISAFSVDRETEAKTRRLDKKTLRELFREMLPKRAPVTGASECN